MNNYHKKYRCLHRDSHASQNTRNRKNASSIVKKRRGYERMIYIQYQRGKENVKNSSGRYVKRIRNICRNFIKYYRRGQIKIVNIRSVTNAIGGNHKVKFRKSFFVDVVFNSKGVNLTLLTRLMNFETDIMPAGRGRGLSVREEDFLINFAKLSSDEYNFFVGEVENIIDMSIFTITEGKHYFIENGDGWSYDDVRVYG